MGLNHPRRRGALTLALAFLCCAVGAGCVSLSTHQTPETLRVGYSRLLVESGIGYVDGVPDYEGLPWGVSYRTGVGERHEIGGKFGVPGGIFLDWKMHAHDREGFDFGFGLLAGLTSVRAYPMVMIGLPTYYGWPVSENAVLYASLRPTAFHQEGTFYAGGTAGVGSRFGGRRAGVFVELSYGQTFGRTEPLRDDAEIRGVYFSFAPFYTMRPMNREDMGL